MGPGLANNFVCGFENEWLKDCLYWLHPVFYRRYVDDVCIVFSRPFRKFREYWSSKHPNISFLIEKKSDGRSYFLDISIFREKGKFVTNAAFSIWK